MFHARIEYPEEITKEDIEGSETVEILLNNEQSQYDVDSLHPADHGGGLYRGTEERRGWSTEVE